MGQIVIRHIDEATLATLEQRAAAQGLSLETSIRRELFRLARPSEEEITAEMDRIAAMSPKRTMPPFAEDLIREGREER
jgi:plasmid stability protein